MRRHYKISVKYFIDKQNDTNDKPIDTDSHWLSDPTLTRIQEIIFDLYDEKKPLEINLGAVWEENIL